MSLLKYVSDLYQGLAEHAAPIYRCQQRYNFEQLELELELEIIIQEIH